MLVMDVMEFDSGPEDTGNLPKVTEVSGKKSCHGKVFIANLKFGTLQCLVRVL